MTLFRSFLYPINLVPTYLNAQNLKPGSDEANFEFGVPQSLEIVGQKFVISRNTIITNFKKIVEQGQDPEVEFLIEYSNEQYGYKKHGYLIKLKTKFSEVLKLEEEVGYVTTTIDEHGEIQLSFDNPEGSDSPQVDDMIIIKDDESTPVFQVKKHHGDIEEQEYQIIT